MSSRSGTDPVASPSLWWDGLVRGDAHPPLETDATAQYAIVGGGYTGLWTAYFLKLIQPDADIVLVEAQRIGHGASGRNGGWLMGALEGCAAFVDDTGVLPIAARQNSPDWSREQVTFSPKRASTVIFITAAA